MKVVAYKFTLEDFVYEIIFYDKDRVVYLIDINIRPEHDHLCYIRRATSAYIKKCLEEL